ncbi:hypothetical protein [Rhizorhabdus sp. FW153]|uniref:hypothetical protein n=1 Tax=Rhizorhabdus sp. FW153 TaxID=3400216 RepID=UPI003CE8377E
MQHIEQRVTLPPDASPISNYKRYYSWKAKERRKTVRALYVVEGAGGRIWVSDKDIPFVVHGGCAVVWFTFDVKEDHAWAVQCNDNGPHRSE